MASKQYSDKEIKPKKPNVLQKNVAHPSQSVTTPSLFQRATSTPDSLTQRDVHQLQRTVGNQSVSRLLTHSPTFQPKPPPDLGNIIQRASTVAESVWSSTHKGSITLGSGIFYLYASMIHGCA